MDKIQKVSLTEQAYNRIKTEILSDEFYEGKKIPSEHALCEILNVSRVVIREALTRLRNEKLIVTYQGKGSFRANPSNFFGLVSTTSEDFNVTAFKQVMDFRTGIEQLALTYAIKQATDAQLLRLNDFVDGMIAVKHDKNLFNNADYNFHAYIVSLANNPLLTQSFENNKNLIICAFNCMNPLNDSVDYAIKTHRDLTLAIIERNLKKVQQILENNSEYNYARITQILS